MREDRFSDVDTYLGVHHERYSRYRGHFRKRLVVVWESAPSLP